MEIKMHFKGDIDKTRIGIAGFVLFVAGMGFGTCVNYKRIKQEDLQRQPEEVAPYEVKLERDYDGEGNEDIVVTTISRKNTLFLYYDKDGKREYLSPQQIEVRERERFKPLQDLENKLNEKPKEE